MATLPPNDPRLLVLVSLASAPRHGHGILLDIAEFACVRLGPGTLYGAISRLESEGLIEAIAPEGRRRPYRLTDRGDSLLRQRLDGLERTVRAGRRRVAVGP